MSTNKQRTPHTTPTLDHAELDTAFEDAGGLSPAEYQKPAPSSLIPKTADVSQSLAVAVDTLVDVVGRNESQLLVSLKPNDYQQLVGALETLTAVVGENKNHLLTPLMDSIDTFIEKCRTEIEEGNEEESDMAILTPIDEVATADPWEALLSSGPRGIEAAYGEDEYDYMIDYEESEDPLEALLSLGPRGIEAAYGEDEYDYTEDAPVEVNPDDVYTPGA